MPWLALTLEVEAASADALGDALLEAGALSVTVLEPDSPACRITALLAEDARVDEFLREAARAFGTAQLPGHRVDHIEDEDWVRRSQSQFVPIVLGERLWIGPTWHQPPEGTRAVARIDPGMAFGTGSHPSTRLALEFLADEVKGGESVLDYGCGSGILAVAATKLGAVDVDAVDIDPLSIATAAANAALNGLALRTALPDDLAPRVYDVVVANILAQPLILLAPLLAARARPGGRIALSGILEPQAVEVAAAYSHYFDTRIERLLDGWALVEGRKR
jgi:ribosomal protein L11 methyltransferase